MKIKNSSVLITGGASGIGKLMGRMALEKGARCFIIWDININGIEATRQELSKYGKVEGYVVDVSKYEIVEEVYKKKPDVLMFSCYIWNYEIIKRLTKNLKKILPNVKIVFGGPEVSFDGKDILRNIDAALLFLKRNIIISHSYQPPNTFSRNFNMQ